MATPRRPLCADLSRENAESLAATASRIDHWLLIEYRGLWSRAPLGGSGLSEEVKEHLRGQLTALAPARLLFVKRPERRGREGLLVYHGRTSEQDGQFFRRELDSYDDLLELDLASHRDEPFDQPLFVVCTHGKRDRCCAFYGRPLYEALRDELDEDWVWQCTHVGGDRFAGNVVVFPEGLYFGRVGPADVPRLVDAHLAGQIDLERYRGRCSYPFAVQAAEQALREELGITGISQLALVSVERLPETWTVTFRSEDGAVHERTVVTELGELTYLTCDAETLRRPRRFLALS
jgi:hypothetical protein